VCLLLLANGNIEDKKKAKQTENAKDASDDFRNG